MPATYTVEWDKDGDGTFSEDISGYVMECHTDQGRKTDLATMPPGYATLILNNADGRFSPDKAAGPYFGDVFMYSRVRIKVTHGSTYGLFWGYVIGWDNKPKTTEQIVTWFLGDRFAIWQEQLVSARLSQHIPINTALYKTLGHLEGPNLISNPSLEENATGWSDLGAADGARDATMKFDGDWSYRSSCPSDAGGEGWRYDASGDIGTSVWIRPTAYVRVEEGTVSFRFRAVDDSGEKHGANYSVGTAWKRIFLTPFQFTSTNRYFELYTNGATEVIVWSGLLYVFEVNSSTDYLITSFGTGTAEIELLAAYREPGLDVLRAIAESEPRVFFFMYYPGGSYDYMKFHDKDWRDTAIGEGPVATFSDDGADIPYHDLILGEDAKDLISEAEIVSQGTYLDENEEATIWELSPTGQVIAATETLKFRVRYSQPARDCSLVLNPDGDPTTFEIPSGSDDGYLTRVGAGHPPAGDPSVYDTEEWAYLGQYLLGLYHHHRVYLRWDTSGIPDGADVSSAILKLPLSTNGTAQDFIIQVRDKAWGAALEAEDWDGTGAIRGTFNTASLPPAGQWFEIELATASIVKDGWTQFELMSDREATEPTVWEFIRIGTFEADLKPLLIVTYSGFSGPTITFKNYGVGADIELTAGSDPAEIRELYIEGKPLKGTSEESKVIAASAAPPPVDRTLSYALPLQGSRTASMETEATRLADRYDGSIRRPALVLRPKTDAVLTQMLARQIGQLIHVENIGSAHGTFIDGDYWIEGIEHDFQPGGEHETIFYLEEV